MIHGNSDKISINSNPNLRFSFFNTRQERVIPLLCTVVFILITLLTPLLSFSQLTVASLNPVVSDIAKQVGGEYIKVIELMETGDNPHLYEPNPEQLRAAHKARIILAAGMGLETYLPDLRDTLTENQQILEVGRTIPPLVSGHVCSNSSDHDHDHKHSTIDPHWWHSIKNLQRATLIIAGIFSRLSPENEKYFKSRSRAYRNKLEKLNSWAKREIYRIPRKERILTTAHTSFGYFCHDFEFTAIPVQGLSSETTPNPRQMTTVVNTIREKNVKAIFPEKNVNPKLIETIIRETGVKQGGSLLAAGPTPEAPTCEAMMRHNVKTIVEALAPER